MVSFPSRTRGRETVESQILSRIVGVTRSWGKKKLLTIQNPTEVRLEALSFKDFGDSKPVEINKAEWERGGWGWGKHQSTGDEASLIFNTGSQPTPLWYGDDAYGDALPVCGSKFYPKPGNCRASYSLNEETMVKVRWQSSWLVLQMGSMSGAVGLLSRVWELGCCKIQLH